MSNHIGQHAENNEIILAGDFNARFEIDRENCTQTVSINEKILTNIINDNNITPASLKADCGIWTKVNRQKERKFSHRLCTDSPLIAESIQTIAVDEEGLQKVMGKKETDHNTILMSLK